MPRSKAAEPAEKDVPASDAESGWRSLSWDDLKDWAGAQSLERGKKYQSQGRVTDLALGAQDDILATVRGSEKYAVNVGLERVGGRWLPGSECTCPVGVSCKHAVAAVVEYLNAIAEKRPVPSADEDDPRWDRIDGVGDVYDDEEDYEPRPKKTSKATKAWDEKVRGHLKGMPPDALADLAWSLLKKSPSDYEAIREKLALRELDPKGLVAEARREIKATTAIRPWKNRWEGAGELPDYRPTEKLLRRLLDLGRADDVVTLGRDLFSQGYEQLTRADDEGETADRLSRCMDVVFEAVARSSLTGPERIMVVIQASLDEPVDEMVGPGADAILDEGTPEDWSAVADELASRLAARPEKQGDDYAEKWARRRIASWMAQALEGAGREDELTAIYESEARKAGEYATFVDHLIRLGRLDEAERWAREGIVAKIGSEPGTAAQLAKSIADAASKQGRWDVAAAHAARSFFEHPGITNFRELQKVAGKAGVEPAVTAAALRFLETGVRPYGLERPAPAPKPPRAKKGEKAPSPPPAPAATRLKVDPAWPLPVPVELIPFLHAQAEYERKYSYNASGPRRDVLVDIALADGDSDAALRWYDAIREHERARARTQPAHYGGAPDNHLAEKVAAAVAESHPDRALEIYQAALDLRLPIADSGAYYQCANYLKLLRPIYAALGRAHDWTTLVASIREKYRNRPRFMATLEEAFGSAKKSK